MTYAACILWTILVAIASAANDAERIALNEKIHHVRAWFIRAALVAIVCIAAGHPLLTVGMGALFSMALRYTLNRLRDLDWRYVSPSSWYDSAWIIASIMVGQLDIPWRDQFTIKEARLIMREHALLIKASEVHWIDRTDGPDLNLLPSWYVQQVHRAGLLAYIAEAGVIALYILL